MVPAAAFFWGMLDGHQLFDYHTSLKVSGCHQVALFLFPHSWRTAPLGPTILPAAPTMAVSGSWLAGYLCSAILCQSRAFYSWAHFSFFPCYLLLSQGLILQAVLPRFRAGFCPDSANGRVFRRLEVVGGIAGDHRCPPVLPGWVLHGPRSLNYLHPLSLHLRASIHSYFANFRLSHHCLFGSWLLYLLYNQFLALNSFSSKYLSSFCFSVSVGPLWPRSMGTLGIPSTPTLALWELQG